MELGTTKQVGYILRIILEIIVLAKHLKNAYKSLFHGGFKSRAVM